MNCKDCPKRDTCTEPCEAMQAELDKLTSCQKEVPVGNLEQGYTDYGSPWSGSPAVQLTPRERGILTLLAQGFTRQDACELLNITRSTLRWHLANARKKHKKPNAFSHR